MQGVSHTFQYDYDLAGRLTDVRKDGVAVGHYEYDDNGNRTSATVRGETSTGTYDDQDRLLSYGGNTYTYTANGDLLTKTNSAGTTSYTYDELGNLVKVILPDTNVIEYLIDGLNRRVGKKVNGTLVQGFLYESQLAPVAEIDGSGNVISRFIYATRVNVPEYMVKNGQTFRLVHDHLGSPRLVVNTATGQVVQAVEYDEFGNVLSDSNPGFQPFGFAGGMLDQQTQLTRFGWRDYDAFNGRWTTKDPIGFTAGDVNLFGYAFNDPVNFRDPMGLEIRVYSSGTFFGAGGAQHVFIWSTEANTGVGRSGVFGRDFGRTGVPNGFDPKTSNLPYNVVTDDLNGMTEAEFIKFVRDRINDPRWYSIGDNDCHTSLEAAFKAAAVEYPGAPVGRSNWDEAVVSKAISYLWRKTLRLK